MAPSATAEKAVASCHQAMGDARWSSGMIAEATREFEQSRALLLGFGEPDVDVRSTLTYLDRRLAELRR